MESIINAFKESSIIIQDKLSHAGITELHGEHDSSNSSGDTQKKLDIISNDIILDNLHKTNLCSILMSEENDDIILSSNEGKYIVAFDPLDGSSNIDCNVCVGTIFCILEDNFDSDINKRILRKGDEIIAAGYILYGPATDLVLTTGKGVQRYILDRNTKEYIYIGDITIGNKKIYSINDSNKENWYQDIKKYVQLFNYKNTKYTQRWVGSMVADVHRTLLYGGWFSYPADEKNLKGKLRVLYECFPMAKLTEAAGGKAIIGNMTNQRILEIIPNDIHERTPILLGTAEEIDKYQA